MTLTKPNPSPPRRRGAAIVCIAILVLAAVAYIGWKYRSARVGGTAAAPAAATQSFQFQRFGFWWGAVPEEVRSLTRDTGAYSNIEPHDYVGAQCPEQVRQVPRERVVVIDEEDHLASPAAANPS